MAKKRRSKAKKRRPNGPRAAERGVLPPRAADMFLPPRAVDRVIAPPVPDRVIIPGVAEGVLAPSVAVRGAAQPAPGTLEADVPEVWNVSDVILDLYEVRQVHEGGAMGLVYRVRHRTWNTDFAVKSPRPEYFRSETHKENFEREAETWVNLDLHPHIVSCHYVRRLGGIPRLFAEYVEGGSLSQWIREGKLYEGGAQQALERILDIAIQMAWGLHFAHEQGLVHQDVKPANVMMTPDGLAKVADFGLARARAVTGEAGMAPGGASILVSWGGRTPAYASPEQMAGEKLGRATDIWSWAVSALEMFTGGVTWGAGPAAGEALEEYLERGPEAGMAPMPEGVVELLRRCLAWGPYRRPKDMKVVATALHEVYGEAVGETYPREKPEAVEHLADGLNNRALSMLDLGKVEQAERLWEEALKADPLHPHVTYNRGRHLWHVGRVTDTELLRQLDTVRGTEKGRSEGAYLLGLVHLERGDVGSARALLEEAARAAPSRSDIAIALETARQRGRGVPGCMQKLQGHRDAVSSVALTPDGRLALSGSWDGTVRVWDLGAGQCLRTIDSQGGMVYSVALTPDGRLALSGGEDETLRLWDVTTGRCLRTFEDARGATSVAFTGDGRFVLSAPENGFVRSREIATGQGKRSPLDHDIRLISELGVRQRASIPKVNIVLSAAHGSFSEFGGPWLFDRWSGGDIGKVASVALGANGLIALSGERDGTLRLWEYWNQRCLRVIGSHGAEVKSVALTEDCRFGLSGGDDGIVRLWDLATDSNLIMFTGHTEWISSLAISPDGSVALSGSGDGTVRVWDLRVRRQQRRQQEWSWSYARPRMTAGVARETAVARETLDGARRLVSEGRYGEAAVVLKAVRGFPDRERHPELMHLWYEAGRGGKRRALTGAWPLRSLVGHTRPVQAVALAPDGRFALSGSRDKTLRLWDLATGRCRRHLSGHAAPISAVALTEDGRFGLSGADDGTVRVWDLAKGACLRGLRASPERVGSVDLTADGRLGLSGSNGTLRIWHLGTGRCLVDLPGVGPTSAALTPDGRYALSGHRDDGLRLHEVATGRCLRTMKGHTSWVTAAALMAAVARAVSGSSDHTLRLWDLDTGWCLRVLTGHTSEVNSVAVTGDGAFALSGSSDGTVRVWDLAKGRCVRVLEGHTSEVTAVALTADGHFALSAGTDGKLQLWELDWEYRFPKPADWKEGARRHLASFLTLHTPYAAQPPTKREPSSEDIMMALTRRGKPSWTEEDFRGLIRQLQYAGYGWLRPEGVRAQLERMARDWQGPPPLFGSGEGTSGGESFLSRLFRRSG